MSAVVCGLDVHKETTYARFKKTVAVDDYTSGYLVRFLLVPISPPREFRGRRAWTVEDDRKIQACTNRLNEIREAFEGIEGFTLTPDALDLFNEWETSSCVRAPPFMVLF